MISTNAAPLRFGHSLEEIDGRLELLEPQQGGISARGKLLYDVKIEKPHPYWDAVSLLLLITVSIISSSSRHTQSVCSDYHPYPFYTASVLYQ
jgi:hypothetical protein